MNLNQFKLLPEDKKLEVVEKRLEELKIHDLKTSQFKNVELDIIWSQASVELKKIGYVLDQTAYKLNRIVLDNEEIITKKEYKEFQNYCEEKKQLIEKNKKLSEQVEVYKNKFSVNVEQQKAGEVMAQVKKYINDDTKTFYLKIPASVVQYWKNGLKISLYDKQVLCEAALINYMNKYTDEKDIYIDIIEHLKNDFSKEMVTYSMIISKQLIDEWKEFCKKMNIFSASQLTSCALFEYANILESEG
mgnify:FL=1